MNLSLTPTYGVSIGGSTPKFIVAPTANKKKRVMVLWSGGVESTSLLLHFLRDTDCEVVSHYVALNNPENRKKREDNSIAELLPLLQNVRKFEHSSSYVEICEGRGIMEDFRILYTIGRAAMKVHDCDEMYRGKCADDDWRNHGGHFVKCDAYLEQAKSTFFENFESFLPHHWTFDKSKAWHVKNLGNLVHLTWSCRTPIGGWDECGSCHACASRSAAFEGKSNVPSVQDQIEYEEQVEFDQELGQLD